MAHPTEVEVLSKALSGIGVDEKSLVSILAKSKYEQKRSIRKGCTSSSLRMNANLSARMILPSKVLKTNSSDSRYEGTKVKEDTAKSEAKALFNAIKNADKKKPIEDEEVIRILTTRSKLHLKEVYQLYTKFFGKSIIEDLEELFLKETIECLCTPQIYFDRVFDSTLRVDANENAKKALTRLVTTQEAENLKEVTSKYAHKIEERVKGAYKVLLLS